MSETGRRRTLRHTGAAAGAVLAHLVLLPVVFAARETPDDLSLPVEPVVMVELFTPPPPPPPPPPPAPTDAPPPPGPKAETPTPAPAAAQPAPTVRPPATRPPPRLRPARPTPRMDSVPLPASTPPTPPEIAMPTIGDAQLAGALRAGAGSGGGGGGGGSGGGGGGGSGDGGGCDLVREIQNALREDGEVREAVMAAHRAAGSNRALLVWDGDWRQTPGQSGKGLAGVRQAIALEVAFAPQACRREAMRGMVLFTLSDGPGAARVALGAGSWRWSDLLGGR
ncbi:hypothetical protein [Brevundimonas sp. GCM10030266]|uniref:hypothetical protein n=1 Tax=Brevundimonas sp. GCM10030266 TaxID=3273386 RepID=UPI00360656CD